MLEFLVLEILGPGSSDQKSFFIIIYLQSRQPLFLLHDMKHLRWPVAKWTMHVLYFLKFWIYAYTMTQTYIYTHRQTLQNFVCVRQEGWGASRLATACPYLDSSFLLQKYTHTHLVYYLAGYSDH